MKNTSYALVMFLALILLPLASPAKSIEDRKRVLSTTKYLAQEFSNPKLSGEFKVKLTNSIQDTSDRSYVVDLMSKLKPIGKMKVRAVGPALVYSLSSTRTIVIRSGKEAGEVLVNEKSIQFKSGEPIRETLDRFWQEISPKSASLWDLVIPEGRAYEVIIEGEEKKWLGISLVSMHLFGQKADVDSFADKKNWQVSCLKRDQRSVEVIKVENIENPILFTGNDRSIYFSDSRDSSKRLKGIGDSSAIYLWKKGSKAGQDDLTNTLRVEWREDRGVIYTTNKYAPMVCRDSKCVERRELTPGELAEFGIDLEGAAKQTWAETVADIKQIINEIKTLRSLLNSGEYAKHVTCYSNGDCESNGISSPTRPADTDETIKQLKAKKVALESKRKVMFDKVVPKLAEALTDKLDATIADGLYLADACTDPATAEELRKAGPKIEIKPAGRSD